MTKHSTEKTAIIYIKSKIYAFSHGHNVFQEVMYFLQWWVRSKKPVLF